MIKSIKRYLKLVLIVLVISACSSDKESQYLHLIDELEDEIANSETINPMYFVSFEEAKMLMEDKTDEKIKKQVESKKEQQKSQFKRIKKKLFKKDQLEYTFIMSDSIGGIIEDIHFIDIALFYEKKESKKNKIKVCVFEMLVLDGAYLLADDIYLTDEKSWLNMVENKRKQLGLD